MAGARLTKTPWHYKAPTEQTDALPAFNPDIHNETTYGAELAASKPATDPSVEGPYWRGSWGRGCIQATGSDEERVMSVNFRITNGKGFGMALPNGWWVSVQFGPGNYCEHYSRRHGRDEEDCGEGGSVDAECAVFNKEGTMVELPAFMFPGRDYRDIVAGRCTPEMVFKLINWAAEQP